jgi:replicative DNA helicase Mcm
MATSSKSAWTEFLNRYYAEAISFLAMDYPGRTCLEVDFNNIYNYDMDLAQELLDRPDEVLKEADAALWDFPTPIDEDLKMARIGIINLPETTYIRDLRSIHINKLITVTGLVSKVTDVRPRIINAAFKCQRCEHTMYVPQDPFRFVEPFACDNDVCGRRGPFKLNNAESEWADAQKLRLQDSPDDLRGGQQPQVLDIDVSDDLAGIAFPGDRLMVTGILRSYQRSTQQGKSTFFDIVLEAVTMQSVDKGFDEIEITPDDEKVILQLSKDPDIINKITASIAPAISGYSEVKESIALQLFSGLPKEFAGGHRIRGDIHVLLVGDPGVAKSQLLRYGKNLAPRGIYTSGKSSTSAGLTVTAVKDDFGGSSGWTLEAGALVLADMGLACVDELDKMDSEDRSSMHEAMEQQTISVAKAGKTIALKSRCALLGAANPKFGRFDKYEPMAKQVNMEPTLLSRFDLIFLILDEPNTSKDTVISKHIFNVHRAGELAFRKKVVQKSGITDEQVEKAMESIKPAIPPDLLRKYIAFAKRKIIPLISSEAEERLNKFYLSLRKQGEDPNAPIPITARQLEALIRLAEACARSRFSDVATLEDAERVIRLVMVSLNQIMKDPETGQLDSDLISSGTGKSQRDKIKFVRGALREFQQRPEYHQAAVPFDALLSDLERSGLGKEKLLDILEKLKTAGEIIEPTAGKYRVVQ